MQKDQKIYVAGHQGVIGSSIVKVLKGEGYTQLITKEKNELDLLDEKSVSDFFSEHKPAYVFLCAAKSGGFFFANKNSPEVIFENIQIQNNVISQAHQNNVVKLMFFGCSSIYPKYANLPLKEHSLLSGPLLSEKIPFSISKTTGAKLIEYLNREYQTCYLSVLPSNVYGTNDQMDPERAHVVALMLQKIHLAKHNNIPQVTFFGSGEADRDFIYADDLAQACLKLMKTPESRGDFNIATGNEITVKEMADIIKKEIGYQGEIVFDRNHHDGVLLKSQDIHKIKETGWEAKISPEEGIKKLYNWYLESQTQ
ncbi:MAG: NAD-dependent epimerase/dehydratase family protein [Deltaproteobacteria bacterium]|nr:NAD-dependent epimerase/dehydratase family protein [Deltaproteobacteria bacterium]